MLVESASVEHAAKKIARIRALNDKVILEKCFMFMSPFLFYEVYVGGISFSEIKA